MNLFVAYFTEYLDILFGFYFSVFIVCLSVCLGYISKLALDLNLMGQWFSPHLNFLGGMSVSDTPHRDLFHTLEKFRHV